MMTSTTTTQSTSTNTNVTSHKRKRPTDGEDNEEDHTSVDTITRGAVSAAEGSSSCPYLDSVQRTLLDFDFEAACSESLQTGPHIYGCLVCGKYFRGRGPSTPAYTHSVEESHYVFVHLSKGNFHCLPDDYEIHDPSLLDIKAALHPTFTKEQIGTIDTRTELSRDLFGRRFLPGFVGLNNLKKTDCINAVVQALAHVPPLRDFFLEKRHDDELLLQGMQGSSTTNISGDKNRGNKSNKKMAKMMMISGMSSHQRLAQTVAQAFGELVRKIWSPQRFKSHVDPHILIQAVSVASNKKFQVGQQAEAGELMAWLLHQLHVGTGGSKKPGSSIVHKIFQGKVRVTTRQAKRKSINTTEEEDVDDRAGSDAEDDEVDDEGEKNDAEMADAQQDSDLVVEETTLDTRFLQLTLDIPEKPLFRDEDGGLVIPQEPFVNLLKKFDGMTFSDAITKSGVAQRKRYQILRLPDFLILHLARFKSNKYSREKNPAIVAFPIKNFDLSDYVHRDGQVGGGQEKAPPSPDHIRNMSVKELKALLKKYHRADLAHAVTEKHELIDVTIDFVSRTLPDLLQDKYFLCANITHQSPADVGREGTFDPLQEGSYKCHVQHRGTQQWYEIQDLHVQEIMPQQIGLTESNLLIFERKNRRDT